jgi:thioredoxin 1
MGEYTTEITSQRQIQDLMTEGDEKTALLDFWAPWCGPCKQMAPTYESVAEQFADEPVDFYKVNTENHPELSEAFHVRSIPTLVLVHDGEILDTLIGAQSESGLVKRTEWLLSKARGEGFLKRIFG